MINQQTKDAVIQHIRHLCDHYMLKADTEKARQNAYKANMMLLKALNGEFDQELRDYLKCMRKTKGN